MQEESPCLTVAVGMSGGVDSSAAAALLCDRGYHVIGLTALMTRGGAKCCSDEDVRRAAHVAGQLGIPHYVVDVHETFEEQVVAPFVDEYLSGRTPSPCVRCNRRIKFGALLEKALELGADRIATGHYAEREADAGGELHLLRGADAAKDQSYFLARLTQAQLARTLFPLGPWCKQDVARFVASRGLTSRKSRESQDLCFVGDGGHGAWIDNRLAECGVAEGRMPAGGDIVDMDGRIVGTHRGLHHYTVGQRKGLGIAAGAPVYVVRLDAAENAVVVGGRSDAMVHQFTVSETSWISGRTPSGKLHAGTQIRYNHEAAESDVVLLDDGLVRVSFAEPQFAVAPGQSAVFYRGREVLGAGWIN